MLAYTHLIYLMTWTRICRIYLFNHLFKFTQQHEPLQIQYENPIIAGKHMFNVQVSQSVKGLVQLTDFMIRWYDFTDTEPHPSTRTETWFEN